ncbi:MAG TPA: methyl-accepting chemotaxis protein, partial [Rhodopila sp.]|nr:methyl-accepting chemotaxis protein [Rhodopila sp.]
GAEQQTGLVGHLTNLATGVEMAGKTISVDEIARLLEVTLDDVVAKILMLSKDSMAMVEALDTLNGNVRHVEACLGEIDKITHVTHMVALNARIEAERSGAAGAAFRVVADEVKQLSGSIQSLATDMNKQLKAVRDGIHTGHATLKQVASVDMSGNIQVKERLGALLPALVSRNTEIKSAVADAAREANAMSADVSGMITGIQFQDRTKQRLEHVIDTLHVIGEAVGDVMNTTRQAVPELAGDMTPDPDWVRNLLSRYTMSELRERFVAQILDGEPVEWPAENGAAAAAGGSVDLF